MSRVTRLTELRIEPTFMFEPPGMFDDDRPAPTDRAVLQERFRKAAGPKIAQVAFVPGSDLLLATDDLLPVIDEVARVRSIGVTNMGEAELAGGYAFLDQGRYVFGVEDDSVLADTPRWDQAPEILAREGKATIRHACDQFIDAQLQKTTVVLTHERSALQYLVSFESLKAELADAKAALQKFAQAFGPVYAKHLSTVMPAERALATANESLSFAAR